MGQTRLAIHGAQEAAKAYPDGIGFVDLAALNDPEFVAQTTPTALKLPEESGRSHTELLADFLRTKRFLLILDNCEHLTDVCATLANALLYACPRLRILATSRHSLGLPGETLWRLRSLPHPEDARLAGKTDETPLPDALIEYDAVRLFIVRAKQADDRFQLTAANAPLVTQVCRRLDGIPFALEMAAAHLKALSLKEISRRLDEGFPLPSRNQAAVLPRHKTLEAALDWSYRLLTDPERLLLQRLSVFAGGWTLEAAEDICLTQLESSETIPTESDDILDHLSALVDKSLVVAGERDGEMRYRFQETMRQYARERLQRSGEEEALRRRHFDYFLVWRQREAKKPDQAGVWFDRITGELDNLRAALAWGQQAPDKAEDTLRLTIGLFSFALNCSHFQEARGWFDATLSRSQDCPPLLRCAALSYAGWCRYGAGDFAGASLRFGELRQFASARILGEESLALQREEGNEYLAAVALIYLSAIALFERDFGAARQYGEEARAFSSHLRNRIFIGRAVYVLGCLARAEGDGATARSLFEQGLSDSQERGDRRLRLLSLIGLGSVAMDDGEFAAAYAYFAEALPSYAERPAYSMEERGSFLDAFEAFAHLAAAQGDFLRSARLFGAAEAERERCCMAISPSVRNDYDQRIAALRASLGDSAFDAAFAQGRLAPLEDIPPSLL